MSLDRTVTPSTFSRVPQHDPLVHDLHRFLTTKVHNPLTVTALRYYAGLNQAEDILVDIFVKNCAARRDLRRRPAFRRPLLLLFTPSIE